MHKLIMNNDKKKFIIKIKLKYVVYISNNRAIDRIYYNLLNLYVMNIKNYF